MRLLFITIENNNNNTVLDNNLINRQGPIEIRFQKIYHAEKYTNV